MSYVLIPTKNCPIRACMTPPLAPDRVPCSSMFCVRCHSWSTDDHRARVCDSTTVSQVLMCDVCQDLYVVRPETPVPGPYSHKIVS